MVAAVVEINMFCNTYSRLLLQFHITGRCNLRCKHCYRTEGDVEKLSYRDIISVINQFTVLCQKYNVLHNTNKRGHINITGGEPFFHSDIKRIIQHLGSKQDEFTYGFLSNGSFIDEELIKLLKENNVSFIQLSIDGDKKTHDFLRADGDYDRVFRVARMLEKSGIRTYISFTANKENYKFLPEVAGECRKNHISKLWSDRIVPIGNGKELCDLTITEPELPEYINMLKKAQGSPLTQLLNRKTQISMNRALQFIGSKGSIYSCSAGDSLITVDEFGRIMPCRRMPIICGDIFTSTLEDVYFNNPTFIELRKHLTPQECSNCKYSYYCNGGAKCQSYAVYGTYKKADPACFLKE